MNKIKFNQEKEKWRFCFFYKNKKFALPARRTFDQQNDSHVKKL